MKLKKLIGMLAVVILAIPGIATATNGYFAHGYGMKAKGMGGAATAMASDAMGGANNPASMVWVGDRLDIGIDWFRPIRSAKREGSIGSANDFSQQSDSNNFFIPEFGYNKMLNNDLSLGVTVSGNGMNTDYAGGTNTPAACTGGVNPSTAPVLNGLCGSGKLGVSIEQVVIAPWPGCLRAVFPLPAKSDQPGLRQCDWVGDADWLARQGIGLRYFGRSLFE